MKNNYHDYNTLLLHSAGDRDPFTGALSTPIYQVSTFHQDPEHPSKYEYSRSANPTRDILEEQIAQLEKGFKGFAFSSGLAAVTTVLFLFRPGDHLIVAREIYGGSHRLFTQVFQQWQLEVDFVDITELNAIQKVIKKNTKAVYFEILSNPFLQIADLPSILSICRSNHLLSIIDNTFLPPYYCRPLEYGADIVLHSATKYLNGHSDVIAGVAAVKDENLAQRLGFLQNALGSILGPQDCWLLLRGIKTLGIRMERQAESAQKIATWLSEQPWVVKTYYPGSSDFPDKDILDGISTGYGSIVTFEVQTREIKESLLRKLSLIASAVSLGAVESILTHPSTMSHSGMPADVKKELGISDNLFRLSVGLENPLDLMEDIKKAINS